VKALTLTQPWATLVAIGAKRVETRSWSTDYRGPLAIHAAKGFPTWARETCGEPPFWPALVAAGYANWKDLPRGVVLCTTRILAVRPTEYDGNTAGIPLAPPFPMGENEWHFGDYGPDRYAWYLDAVVRLAEPAPAVGSLGLWDWSRA
jgi:activating signal cointegrator 1